MLKSWRQAWILWVAAALLSAAAMAPTLTAVLQHMSPEAAMFAEVCAAAGADGHALPSRDGGGHHHCAACLLPAPLLALGPTPMQPTLLLALGDALPALFLRAPRPLFAWASAQPRAPPLAA